MKRLLLATAIAACPAIASAASSIDAASTCLTDSTSGKDRKVFVKWVFIAMSKHPEIQALSAVDVDVEVDTNQAVGELVTRLFTEDCGEEIRAMIREHGASSVSKAFEVFGRVAMVELMADPNVGAAMAGIEKFTDHARIQEALKLD